MRRASYLMIYAIYHKSATCVINKRHCEKDMDEEIGKEIQSIFHIKRGHLYTILQMQCSDLMVKAHYTIMLKLSFLYGQFFNVILLF